MVQLWLVLKANNAGGRDDTLTTDRYRGHEHEVEGFLEPRLVANREWKRKKIVSLGRSIGGSVWSWFYKNSFSSDFGEFQVWALLDLHAQQFF
jgi:hypothetical protein